MAKLRSSAFFVRACVWFVPSPFPAFTVDWSFRVHIASVEACAYRNHEKNWEHLQFNFMLEEIPKLSQV